MEPANRQAGKPLGSIGALVAAKPGKPRSGTRGLIDCLEQRDLVRLGGTQGGLVIHS